MKTLTTIELAKIVQELQVLVEGRINKIYQKEDEFIFLIYNKGKYLLRFYPGILYLASSKSDMPLKQTGFCGWLRKYLSNAKIKTIQQYQGRKIVELVCKTKDKTYKIYFDLFRKGNLIIEENKVIIAARTYQEDKYRTIQKGKKLLLPEYTDLFSLTEQEFVKKIMETTRKNISTALAIDFGLSGLYAKEACATAAIDPKANNITIREAQELHKKIQELIEKLIDALVIEGKPLPFPLETVQGEGKKYDSYNSALDSVLTTKKKEIKKQSKTEKIIQKQEEYIVKLEEEAKTNQRKGELLYEHYQELKELLTSLREGRKQWSVVKEKVLQKKYVKTITDTGEVTIEFIP